MGYTYRSNLLIYYTKRTMPKDVYNSHYEKLPNGEVRCIDDEIPFEIPSNWAWVRVKHIVNVGSARRVHERDWRSTGVPFYRAREIGKLAEFGKVDNDLFIEQALYNEFSKSGVPLAGDLMVTAVGTLGKVYVVHENEVFYYKDGSVLCLENVNHLNPYFLKLAIESPCFINQYKGESQGTTVATLTMVRINEYLLPVPPLNEQNRIVAKIESLQPIIDKYSKAQQELDNLNSEVYNLLKKSILQEAIQGRLVPQDSNEEQATKLLERIRTEKQALVKQGKLKAKDITDSIIYKCDDNKYYEKCGNAVACIDDEIPFEVPNTWSWCRLGDLISTKTGLAYSKPNLEIRSNNMVRVLRGGNIFNGSWCMKSDDVMISSEFVKQDLYLRKGYFITPAVTSWENMGKTALVRENYDNVVVGGFVLMMCPFYTDEIVEEYLNYFFQSTMFQQYCQSITNKSGQAFYNLSRNKLLQLLIPIPPVEEQKRIYHRLNDALASIMSR